MVPLPFNLSFTGLKHISLRVGFIMPSIVADILQFLKWLQGCPIPVAMTVHSGNSQLANEKKKKSRPWSLSLGVPRRLDTAIGNFPLEMKTDFPY